MSARPPSMSDVRALLRVVRDRAWSLRYDLEEADPGRWRTLERVRELERDLDDLRDRLEGRAA